METGINLFVRDFNSIKVRLERTFFCTTSDVKWYFNSIKVRLELLLQRDGRQLNNYFNSIKVRLEHTSRDSQGCILVFQFHKGTIRTLEADLLQANLNISIP